MNLAGRGSAPGASFIVASLPTPVLGEIRLTILRSFPYLRLPRKSVLGAACALLVVACGSGSETRQPDDNGIPKLGDAKLQLLRAQSCDDLLTRIQDSILVQLALRAEQLKSSDAGDYYYGPGSGSAGRPIVDLGSAAPPRDTADVPAGTNDNDSAADPSSAPPAPTAPGNGNSAVEGEEGGGGFSGTTVQVKDVDEADIVKADGDRIYLLHGSTLFVLQGWPANATQVVGSVPVEGQPTEMFVANGKAVVFSRVYQAPDGASERNGDYSWGYTKISVLDVSGDAPSVLRESFVEGDYLSSRRHGDVVRAIIQDGFKIPRLDSPNIEYNDPFGQRYPQADIDEQVDDWLARIARSVRATDLGDWLPRELTKQGGDVVAVAPRCADYYSPDPGLTENGVTSVVSLDIADVSAPLAGATIIGRAERVYANESALLITQTDYRYSYEPEATEQTIIHRFDIGGNTTAYSASGAVAGTINNQFSLDERDGIIRVSTTEQPFGRFGVAPGNPIDIDDATPVVDLPATAPGASAAPAGGAPADPAIDADLPGSGGAANTLPIGTDPLPTPQPVAPPPPQGPVSVSRVVTLGTEGDSLEVLGSTEDFGQTETIFATRFIGDRGYVVTFRQTDPLFVIDLADPTNPHVVGELHIPGFSNYLFPLDEDHLFAIGRDATPEGITQGLALQIFDVSDPAHPALSTKYVYSDVGESPANIDHRAITFHPDRNLVAFPHRSYATGESTLDIFELTDTRISPLGGVAMGETLDLDRCLTNYFGVQGEGELEELRAQLAANPEWEREVFASCGYSYSFRRGLFRDDFVYGISNTGVFVYDVTEMGSGAVGEVNLPAEVYDRGGGGGTLEGVKGPPPPIGVSPPAPAPDEPARGGAGGASSGSAGSSAGGSPGSN
jgi:hypothetical protein